MIERIPKYDDLQIRIDREGGGSYRTLASALDGRTGRGAFDPPVTDDELDDFVQRVGLARRRRGPPGARMQEVKKFGSQLFDALMQDQIARIYEAARAAAQENGRGLRITLQLSGAPELMRLPWEFLYQRPFFLSQSIRTPLVRSLDIATPSRPRSFRPPLRILGRVSSPSGYQELDAEDERRKLEKALDRLRRAGLVELTWLDHATLADFGRRISEPDDIHILHYIGHGAYDERTEDGILVLVGESPDRHPHPAVPGREEVPVVHLVAHHRIGDVVGGQAEAVDSQEDLAVFELGRLRVLGADLV